MSYRRWTDAVCLLGSHPKIIGYILKNKQKNKYVCTHETIRLNLMKMKMKMKNRSHRYDINKLRFRHEHKYSIWSCLYVTVFTFLQMFETYVWKLPVKEFGYSKAAGLYQFFPKKSAGSQIFLKHLF